MRKIFLLSILVVAFLGVSLTVLTVYRSKAQETTSENLFMVLNEKAKAARGGNPAAVQELVDTIVKVTGFKDYLVGQPGLEFKDRVKRAEVLYRQNQHAGITEEKIVYAVNGLKNKLGTPETIIPPSRIITDPQNADLQAPDISVSWRASSVRIDLSDNDSGVRRMFVRRCVSGQCTEAFQEISLSSFSMQVSPFTTGIEVVSEDNAGNRSDVTFFARF
ncbi:MAG: hypothetical protein IGR93_00010 [Hydrococcus sp. C42_A2020_068]|nr:hypothetical protein [Hydrococcus sp. C42_A2020_068]